MGPVGARERAYAAKALKGNAAELAETEDGSRNNKLNAIAYRMGRMIGAGWIERAEVESVLEEACHTNGLSGSVDDWHLGGSDEVQNTMASGIDAGMEDPVDPLPDATPPLDDRSPHKRRKTVKEFCNAYRPARRIVGNFIEAGYVYFLTAPAFAGKTQFALTLMHAIAAKLDNLLNIEVREGRVAYLALENPDDTRKRIMGQRYNYSLDHDELATKITIIDEFTRRNAKGEPISPLINADVELRQDCEENGPLSIVFVDSYQAAFAGDNFNDNTDMLETMRLCRDLTQLPGNPAVIVLAHPVKNASEDNLLPYGGNAAFNEGDGNLTLWQDAQTKIIKFHWLRKLRGTPFEPKLFAIKKIQCPDLLDEEGRQCEVPIIEPITCDAEPEARQEGVRRRQKTVVLALHGGKTSFSEISGETSIAISSVQRTLEQLVKLKLVEKTLDGWALTKKGKAEAQRIKDKPAEGFFETPD